jgi:NAD(P)-dependent dehydrogenase (short-subunit alcohol dehydrogenase family)
VLEQCGLPDARLPPENQHTAPAGSRFVEQHVQHRALVSPTAQNLHLGIGHGQTLRRSAAEGNRTTSACASGGITGDPERLRAALSPLVAAPDAPGVVIYNAALMTFDELLTVSPEQLADAYAVDVIGGVLTAQLAVPAMRAAGGGTLLFTGGGFADALPETFATLSLGKVALRAAATMFARQLRDDDIHAGSVTILGQIAAGTPFDPDGIADAYWAICNEQPDAWTEEYRFSGAEQPPVSS